MTQNITPTTVPGQNELQRYGVDADGNLYVFQGFCNDWVAENAAEQMRREARAAGRRDPLGPSKTRVCGRWYGKAA